MTISRRRREHAVLSQLITDTGRATPVVRSLGHRRGRDNDQLDEQRAPRRQRHLNITALNSNGAGRPAAFETQRLTSPAPPGGQLMITASIQQTNPANGLGYCRCFRAIGAGYRTNLGAWPGVGENGHHGGRQRPQFVIETLHCGTAPAATAPSSTA